MSPQIIVSECLSSYLFTFKVWFYFLLDENVEGL